jgi:hypothetical protein
LLVKIILISYCQNREMKKLYIYCDVLPVNTSNNSWVADFISRFIGCTPSGITITCNTSNLISHKPATSSGSQSAPIWRKPLLRSFHDELLCRTLVMNSCDELLRNQSLTASVISVINCWSVRCHNICVLTDRYLVATIPHCSGC